MRQSRFTEEQINRRPEGRTGWSEGRRSLQEAGISEHTFYRWRAKCGGMDVSDAKKLRSLENENRRLKTLVADLTLDNRMLKAVVERKW